MDDFRPKSLDEIVGQGAATARLRRIATAIRNGNITPAPLLLHGPPGTGKTSAARAFGREVLGEQFEVSFSELKSLDERSPDRLAEIIMNSRTPPKRGAPFRILFVDEVESLLPAAQEALRPAMEGEEDYSDTAMFILACNDLGGMSKALQSRCTAIEFKPLDIIEMRRVLSAALAKTPFQLDEPSIESIIAQSNGVPREAIKLMLEEGGARHKPPEPDDRVN